ncbi:unnamed protein product [Dicrocoelium dendriticum]|nr:unnamed protein product [Dicrocoelium dendriticum]
MPQAVEKPVITLRNGALKEPKMKEPDEVKVCTTTNTRSVRKSASPEAVQPMFAYVHLYGGKMCKNLGSWIFGDDREFVQSDSKPSEPLNVCSGALKDFFFCKVPQPTA